MTVAVAAPVEAVNGVTFTVQDTGVRKGGTSGSNISGGAAGGSGTYQFAWSAGNQGWMSLDPTGFLELTPDCSVAVGAYPVTAKVSDDAGATWTDSNEFVISVVVPAPIVHVSGATATEGSSSTASITVDAPLCGEHAVFFVNAGDLPSWATLTDNTDNTATLEMSPGLNVVDPPSGPVAATVRSAFVGSTATIENFDITVTNTNQPPVLDPIGNQTVAEGGTLDVPVSASDPDRDLLLLVPGAAFPTQLHANLTDNGDGTGTLHFAPDFTAASGSPYTIDVAVTDATSAPVHQTFQLTVTNTDQPPVLDPIVDQTVAEGATLDVAVNATDADGDAITLDYFGIVDPALHATLTDNGDGTGTLHFAPDFTAASGSPYTISVDASTLANTGTVQTSFELTVTNASPSDPVVTVPADMTVEATSAAGAVVSFSATATDAEDGNVTASVQCNPASGSTFALGTTQVSCTAIDSENNIGVAHFNITVEDTTAPQIGAQGGGSLPDIKVTATSKKGAVVTFSAVATDAVDGSVTVTCTPASGSLFPVGKTVVTCTATDANQNSSRTTFTVTVAARPSVSVPPTDARIAGGSPASPAPAGLAWVGLLLLATVGFALGFARRRSSR